MEHVAALQAGTPFATVQVRPHPPQFFTSLATGASQPVFPWPSQSAYPMAQVMLHCLLSQCGVAFGPVGQTRPQAPQLAAFDDMSASQPFFGLPSQSPKPRLQRSMVQAESTQRGVPLGTVQDTLQPPQFAMS